MQIYSAFAPQLGHRIIESMTLPHPCFDIQASIYLSLSLYCRPGHMSSCNFSLLSFGLISSSSWISYTNPSHISEAAVNLLIALLPDDWVNINGECGFQREGFTFCIIVGSPLNWIPFHKYNTWMGALAGWLTGGILYNCTPSLQNITTTTSSSSVLSINDNKMMMMIWRERYKHHQPPPPTTTNTVCARFTACFHSGLLAQKSSSIPFHKSNSVQCYIRRRCH